jgi:hypothetical protein
VKETCSCLLEDGERRLVMHQPIVLPCPARLMHGSCYDAAVPWQTSLALRERLERRNVAEFC